MGRSILLWLLGIPIPIIIIIALSTTDRAVFAALRVSISKELFMSTAALNARSDAILSAEEEIAGPESGDSAVSWGAIIAGAVVASALSLALLIYPRRHWPRISLSVVQQQRLGYDVRCPRGSLVYRCSTIRIGRRRISGGSLAHSLGQRPQR